VVGGARLGTVGLALPARTTPLPKGISARGWVIADLDTGDVLAARNAHGRYPPASTLKWLTALTLLPQLDKHKWVICSYPDVDVDGTRVGLVQYGRYSVDLLFQAMLMASGNDAANALARVAGSVPRTVAAMNATARSIQAYDTHAATPSGLDGPHQLTSAYDLALIGRADLARADFRKYTAQKLGTIPAQGTKYHAFQFANDNKLLYNYPGAMGGKTGYTDDAGQTFVGAANHDGRRLVAVLMRGTRQPIAPWEQAAHLLDYGFATAPGTKVGSLIEPDPSLVATPEKAADDTALKATAAIPAADALPVRVGVAFVGAVIVFCLIMAARSMNRRPQH
jgi:D-alanyl-D-alanine carboxypeptidase (penicillin-binding protein 5/6)